MLRLYIQLVGFFIILVLLPSSVSAESARDLVESGNEAFFLGDFETSLQNYEKAADLDPDSAVVLFNRGDALYKQEKYDEALDVFEGAAAKAMENDDQELEALSRYNMGNSAYRRAEILSREDLQQAFEEYRRSSEFFQTAVKRKPGFPEAAQNLELSRLAAKQVEELIQQQEQQAREQQQQKQEIAKELENLQKEQQEAAEQSRDMAQSQQQEGTSDAAAQQAQNQKSITERTREAGEKLGKLSQKQNAELPEELAREHVKRALEKQEEAEKKLQQNNPSDAQKEQKEAARELQKARQQLEQGQDKEQAKESPGQEQESQKTEAERQQQQESKNSAEEPGQQEGEAQPVAETPGRESPEDIINEELENRKYRSLRGGTGYKPVDKDW
jgi:tetratricopeptide (TPR) repeat protein